MIPHHRRLHALGGCGALLLAAGGLASLAFAASAGLSSDGGSLKAQKVDASQSNALVQRFYAARKGRLAWTPDQAKALTQALDQADQNAIDPAPFLALVRGSGARKIRDVRLTHAALAYARALSQGLTDPGKLFDVYTLKRNQVDVAAGLSQALRKHDVGGWLQELAPQDAEYKALSQAYLAEAQQAGQPSQSPIASGNVIKAGDSDPRVPQIAQRLQAAGMMQAGVSSSGGVGSDGGASPGAAATSSNAETNAETPASSPIASPSANSGSSPSDSGLPPSDLWTPALADALKNWQRAHGLAADGEIGANTLSVMNTTAAARARRLAVNLERRRWLQRDPPDTRIDVNIASTQLTYVKDGENAWSTRVVAGKPDWKTPLLQADFDRVVVNPPWIVPYSIAHKQIIPKGPGYLSRNHMHWKHGHIVQTAGPWAALGLVKFDVQDHQAIYLHDTDDRSVFDKSQRHLSHGCIRVDGAVDFARRLAQQSGKGDAFDAALKSGDTRTIDLGHDMPVRLLYRTAYVGEDGKVAYRPDIYGWDAKVAAALGVAPVPEDKTPKVAALLGP